MNLPQLLYAYTCIPEVGPSSLKRIVDAFTDPDEAWAASDEQLSAIGLKPNIIRAIGEKRSAISPISTWAELTGAGVATVTIQDNDYPSLLREIHAPPPLLLYRGQLPAGPCVAIVGTRRCTGYGESVARSLARELAASGVTVVSGLAYGTDAAAHRGAIEGSGRTVAVVGTGLAWDVMYPAEHRRLAEQILELGGCIVSEHALHAPAHPGHFPRRNRIVSGLCAATVVVEAGEKSGALLTAHLALEQNREVMAVPGPITSPASAGTNRLLKRGATPCTCTDDVLEAIGALARTPTAHPAPPPPPGISEIAGRVLNAIEPNGTTPDSLADKLSVAAHDLAIALTELELAGAVARRGASIQKI